MFRNRHSVMVGALACLIAGAGAVPAGVAAHPPQVTGFPPQLTEFPSGVSELPQQPDITTSSIMVTTLVDAVADDGACSLREAITAAETNIAGPDTAGRCHKGSADDTDLIEFATGGVITLTGDLPTIADRVAIDGSTAPAPVTIDGADTFHPFTVDTAGSLDIYGLTVTNGATTNAGGAITNGGWLTLMDVTISSSSATLAGGGISAGTGSFTWVEQSTITGNSTDGLGGGIRSSGSTVLFDTIVSGNVAQGGGGGLMTIGIDGAVVYNTTFSDNSATGPAAAGGAIRSDGYLALLNATLVGNTAAEGGAIQDNGDLELYNSTLTTNDATAGSGLVSTGSPILVNNIVLGNTGSDPELDATPDVTSSHNLTALPDGVDLGQILDPTGLADNGGFTPTVALVRDAANPAWGGGDDVFCVDFGLTFDQRMYARSSPCDLGAYEIDDLAPAVATPTITLPQGGRLSGSALAGRVAWSGSDDGSGLAGYELEVNVNGTGYNPVVIDPAVTLSLPRLANGSRYQYRVRAVDGDGNWSAWKTGPAVTAKLLQQTATGVSYSSGWKKDARAAYSGGSAKYAKAKGAWVKFTATGRVFSFITTKAPSRGKAKVYVDGKYVATISLKAASTSYRVQAWTKTFSSSRKHTIKIVLLGTSGRPRVDVDAFAVLK